MISLKATAIAVIDHEAQRLGSYDCEAHPAFKASLIALYSVLMLTGGTDD